MSSRHAAHQWMRTPSHPELSSPAVPSSRHCLPSPSRSTTARPRSRPIKLRAKITKQAAATTDTVGVVSHTADDDTRVVSHKAAAMSSSRVTKSLPFLVAPAEPTPAGTVHLTDMDAALASLTMTAVLVYDQPVHQPAETIRRALSRALVEYYPVAGRLVGGGAQGGDVKIACTGDGIAFVGASASCALRDAGLTDRRPAVTVDDLTVVYADLQHTDGRPLMLVQVTEFACSGFTVGVTWDHMITDGVGMAQFLQHVGDLARGHAGTPAVGPVRVDRRLPELPPPIISMTKGLVASPHNDLPTTYVSVPLTFINKIKAEFRRSTGDQESCTAFDVFVAVLWKCRTRATTIGSGDPDQSAPMALAFTANLRKPAGAGEGYYGNLFAFGLAAATRGEVANGDVLDLIKLVRDAKARVPFTFADGAKQVADEMDGRLRGLRGYDTLYVTSWWNLGLDEVDFGGGGSARVMGNMERKVVPACILCGRKDKADGVAAMALCVREQHQEAFHAELTRLVG